MGLPAHESQLRRVSEAEPARPAAAAARNRYRRRAGRACAATRTSPACAAFIPGDSPRRIAWKAYAREQGLQVKVYAGTAVTSHSFDWDSAAPGSAPRRGCRSCVAGSRMPTRPAAPSDCELPGVEIAAEHRAGASAALPDGAGAVRRARDRMAEPASIALAAAADVAADAATPRLGHRRAGARGGAARSRTHALDPAARRGRRGTAASPSRSSTGSCRRNGCAARSRSPRCSACCSTIARSTASMPAPRCWS